jgi:hypothetical protein
MRAIIQEFVGDTELSDRRQEIDIEEDTLLTIGRLAATSTNNRIHVGGAHDVNGSDAFSGLSRIQATVMGYEVIDGRLSPTVGASQLGIWTGTRRVARALLDLDKCPAVTLFNNGIGRIELRVVDSRDPDAAARITLSEGNLLAELRHYIATLEAQVRRLEETTTSAIAALQARDQEHDTRIRWQSVQLLGAVAVACVVWLLAGKVQVDQTFAIALLSTGSAIAVAVINKK